MKNEQSFKSPEKLNFSSALRFIDKIAQSREFKGGEVLIDFSKCDFSEPSGSLLLIRWILNSRIAERRFRFEWGGSLENIHEIYKTDPGSMNKHQKWLTYQKISGFYDAIDGVQKDLIFAENKNTQGRFVPYSALPIEKASKLFLEKDEAGATRECNSVAISLSRQVFKENDTVKAYSKAMREIVENIVFYAGSEAACYVMAQYYESKLELAIIDEGVGLLHSLRASHPGGTKGAPVPPIPVDHASAISQALTVGRSSTNAGDRGYGLPTLLEASKRGGRMYVATAGLVGRGSAVVFNKVAEQTFAYPISGTFIGLLVNPNKVDLDKVEADLKTKYKKSASPIK